MEWKTLCLVEKVTNEIKIEIESNSDIFRFKMLPLIALKAGHPWESSPAPGLRKIAFTQTSYAVAWAINRALLEANHLARTWAINGNRWVMNLNNTPPYMAIQDLDSRKIDTLPLTEEVRIAHPTAIALSLQLRQRTKMTDDHILSITTHAASKFLPVLVAAGNWGSFGPGTLSPLARLPWTIAVGASSDSEGKELHPKSSVGKTDSKLGEGVTVVAYGENSFVSGEFGTSFAVPRALRSLMLLTSFILQLRTVEETRRTGLLGGTPLLHHISVDIGFTDFDPSPTLPLPMIPRIGINEEALHSTLNALNEAGLVLRIEPSPTIMNKMLISSAKPMPNYKPHEVGYGFVSTGLTIKYLSAFTGLDLAKLFFDDSELNPSLTKALSSYKLANKDELDTLNDIAVRSALSFSIDYRTGKIHASMRDPSMDPNETGFRKEKNNYSWPPTF